MVLVHDSDPPGDDLLAEPVTQVVQGESHESHLVRELLLRLLDVLRRFRVLVWAGPIMALQLPTDDRAEWTIRNPIAIDSHRLVVERLDC
jgi:hypothetical protein